MVTVDFTPNLKSHVAVDRCEVEAATVGEALARVFSRHPRLRGYVLDDQGAVRKHIAIVVDGVAIDDRSRLSDPVPARAEIFVIQALSGG